MQTLVAHKAALRGAVVARPQAGRPARSSVVVGAVADSRRAVLTGLLAGAAFTSWKVEQAQALTPVDLFDDRAVKATGYDALDEAREDELPISVRDGFEQFRKDVGATKKRLQESKGRIEKDIEPYIQKSYWTAAREELRRQVGTLRFDLATLSSSKGDKASKKAALAASRDFIGKVEQLDYSLRQKNKSKALSNLEAAKKSLGEVVSSFS